MRLVRWAIIAEALFLIGLAVVFVCQLIVGIGIIVQPGNSGDVDTVGARARQRGLLTAAGHGAGESIV